MNISSGPLKILLVEARLEDFYFVEKLLRKEHEKIDIFRASTFKEANAQLNTNTFDAILLDLDLPDSDNVENLVVKISSLASKSAIIALTGECKKDFGVKSLSLGISDFLLKDELKAIHLSKSIYYSIERKRIENQLIESEQKYKSLFDFSPLPMWVLDRKKLKFLDVNSAAIEMYGYSREEFLTMTVRDLWANKVEPEIEELIVNRNDNFFNVKATHIKKNGDRIFLDVQSNPIIFDGVKARVSLVNNITAQLEAERALNLSEQRFKALVQDGSDLMMIINIEGDVSYVSPSAELVTGISAGKLQQNNFFGLIHHEDVNMVKEHLLDLKNKKRILIPSYRIKSSENSWKWIETIATDLTDDPAVEGIVANSRDITDFVLQEIKLKESLQRYDIVAKATSDTITDYQVNKDHMEYNEGIEIMFGYHRNEVENNSKWWHDKVHPEDREHVLTMVTQLYKQGQNQLQLEYRFRCADGSYKNILDRSYLVKDDEGNAQRLIGSMQDITELRNYIQTIEKHNNHLKDIAWTQSHVVRAPLARIMGLIDLLQNDKNIEDVELILNNILSSAKELDQIIRKIGSKTVEIKERSFKC